MIPIAFRAGAAPQRVAGRAAAIDFITATTAEEATHA